MNLTQLLLFLVRFIILHFFKQYIFVLIDYIEKKYKCIDVKTMIFYAGIINEKLTFQLNSYLLL